MGHKVIDDTTGELVGSVAMNDNKNKRNKDYVMMYRQFINQISDLGIENPIALKVLLFLVKHMDNRNALVITMELMSDMTKISRQTISKKLKYLEEEGWIMIANISRSNVYIVNPDVVWTAYADDKAYCKFDAKVMLDPKDNWAFQSKDKVKIRHIEKDILIKAEKDGMVSEVSDEEL